MGRKVKIIPKKDLFEFSKSINPSLVVNLTYANQNLEKSSILVGSDFEEIINRPETEVFVCKSRKTSLLPILEKEYFSYLVVIVKVKDKEIIDRFNRNQKLFFEMELIDNLDTAQDHLFFRFRLSMNSSFERSNIGFCEKVLKEDWVEISKLFTSER